MNRFSYVGKYRYALVFRTFEGGQIFLDTVSVDLVLSQILRASKEKSFEITAYCFMPDHVHLLIEGTSESADCKAFIRAAKQYSGYSFRGHNRATLWNRYCYEHVIRDDFERSATIAYILKNPVVAGLASTPSDYPYLGSERYTVAQLIEQAGSLHAELPPEGGSHSVGTE
jgi:putative transposase